ncbi:MAG: hypothetical protein Q4P09_08000 [Phascolarctobacterium sp.]|nr:hypothetical protein [Phascolarctobacterium sp.]
MQIKLGIIGEQHAIASLNLVIQEYDEISIKVFLDEQDNQAIKIISEHQEEVNAWLVFDQTNYLKIENWGQSQKPIYYIPYRGASFYKVLCSVLYQKLSVDEVSIDTIPYDDIVSGLEDMGIPYTKLHSIEDDGHMTIEDYLNFHKQLYSQGITKAAITKSYYVKSLLEQSGIPAFCILPMRVTVRNILNLILSHFHIWRVQESQIAVQVFDFNLLAEKDTIYSVDDLYGKEITITQKLLSYAKSINGSLKSATGGNFYIFTTRGNLEKLTNGFKKVPNLPILQEVNKHLRACGIGLGKSASEAEFNAVIALKHACNDAKGTWYVVKDDKSISGPLGSAEQLDYQVAAPALEEISKKTALSINTLSKICHAIKVYGRNELNAQELANTMQILPRSARRILTTLTENGYAEEIGVEMLDIKGRPRKIYKIKM